MIPSVILSILVGLLVVVTVAPLLPVGAWFVRLGDFPRMQIVAVAALLGILVAMLDVGRGPLERLTWLGVCGLVVLWQASHFVALTPLWPVESPAADGKDAIRVAVANLRFENTQREQVVEELTALDADVLLLIEIDEAWAEALKPLRSKYPHRHGVVAEEGLGMILWSKLSVSGCEVRHLVSEQRPSIFADIETPDGATVHFVGVHPTPPGLYEEDHDERHDSRIRDAELMLVAREVAERPDDRWLVTGDFNDVAWSHTTRLFKRMSGLKDPRVGRGLYNTYHADYPLVLRFPIDHVFVSAGAGVADLRRFRPTGSDHFGILTSLAFQSSEKSRPDPEGDDPEESAELIAEGLDDAEAMAPDDPPEKSASP
ncbi:Endonuclease/Exonuclease/phosphatase family protein [Botrimarina colliarenosi]|uniref:Endonuclease/Exonuclease/phosphatase family protein n=2 Tax=Botrimarina colliarenosi TaxID=2528001 RepID=A0A5C6ABE3_9BACT|nr:Endonuclease/Exonuclease/phosphatase family protein [Botrimarina colliarenosi]